MLTTYNWLLMKNHYMISNILKELEILQFSKTIAKKEKSS